MRSSVLPKGPLERHPSLFCLLIGTQPFLLVQVMETQRKEKKKARLCSFLSNQYLAYPQQQR